MSRLNRLKIAKGRYLKFEKLRLFEELVVEKGLAYLENIDRQLISIRDKEINKKKEGEKLEQINKV